MNKKSLFWLLVLLVILIWLLWPRPISAPVVEAPLTTQAVSKTVAAVVPHHDLVAAERRQVLADWSVKLGKVSTIIVVSPDHFSSAESKPITTSKTWQLSSGQLAADSGVVERLIESGVFQDGETAFVREHGISNLMIDLATIWPEVKVVPVILPAKSDLDAVVGQLKAECRDCALIASVDMSHYQPAALAALHDRLTERALVLADDDLLAKAEVDCGHCLVLARRWAGDDVTFSLQAHTNSGDIASNPQVETTTHLMGWFEDGNVALPPSATMLFGGDVMLGRDIAQKYQNASFKDVFSNLGERLFWGVDLSFVNFEAPISTDKAVPALQANNLRFIAPAVSTAPLVANHINYAGLANNHTLTWGAKIFTQTEEAIKAAGLLPVGRPNEVVTTKLPAATGRLPLAVIAVNYVDGPMPGVTEAVQKATDDGYNVVVIPHWGVEYQETHNREQEALARDWVEAGADLVIGGHPHVIQDAEVINGVPVFYSLGNLVFDQYFSTETQRGLLVGAYLTENETEVVVLPIKQERGRPSLLRDAERKSHLDRLCQQLTGDGIKQDCEKGVFLIEREK